MMIDTSAYVGHWPFRKVRGATLQEIAPIAAENGTTHMIVSSINAIFYKDTMEGNLELVEELKSYQGDITYIPFAVINPTYPEWEADMKKCITELGFRGIELAPAYHHYSIANEGAAAFQLAGEMGVPVRVQNEFENIRQHHWMDVTTSPNGDEFAALLAASEKTCLIIGGYFPCVMGEKLQAILKTRDNVFFDIRRMDTFADQSWEKTREYMDPKHLCYGTMTPFNYIAPALVRIQFAPGSDEEKKGILSENIRSYLGL